MTETILTRGNFGSSVVDNSGTYHIIKEYNTSNTPNLNTPHTKIKVIYTFGSCSTGGAENYIVISRAGADPTDLDNYETLFNDDYAPIGSKGQITRELILNTSSNTFAFGFYFLGNSNIFPITEADFIDWHLDNIEVWVK